MNKSSNECWNIDLNLIQVSVDSIDDKEDMQFADEAFDILGFTKEEKYNVFKLTASVMHLGELKFKKKSGENQFFNDIFILFLEL